MCRLGYLKILVQITRESQNYPLDYISRLLHDEVVKRKKPKQPLEEITTELKQTIGLSTTGLIPAGRAMNYIEFSYKLGFFDEQKKILGPMGRTYQKFLNVKRTKNKNSNSEISHSLILDSLDKVFFFTVLLQKDRDILIPFINYMQDKKKVTRQEGMNYLTEEILIKQCEKNILSFGFHKRNSIRKNLPKWNLYPKERIRKPKDWSKTEGYAFYRHNGNPRLEWLVDVGFLKKIGSTFEISDISDEIVNVVNLLVKDDDPDFVYHMGKIFVQNTKEASKKQIKNYIIESYRKFHQAGYLSVDFNMLSFLISMDCLKNNLSMSINDVKNIIDEMKKNDPKYVIFHLDSKGKPRFVKIDLNHLFL